LDLTYISANLLLIVLLVALNGFFVAAEFTIVKVRPSQLEELIQKGSARARYAKQLVEHLDVSLSVTQLGITLVSLALGWVGEPFLAAFMEPVFSFLGLAEHAHTISFAVAFSVITAAHIILGELAPKNIAIQRTLSVMLAIAIPLLLFQKLTYPFVWLLNHVANWAAAKAGFDITAETDDAHSEDEIRLLMEESRKQGYIDKTEFEFVDNVFEFAEKKVRDIMIPRTDMICLYLEDSSEENLALAREKRLTRYPVCGEDKDDVVGFVHIKDIMEALLDGKRLELEQLMREPMVVPEIMAVSRLLQSMREKHQQLAIVVDEYGGTAGMVTLEDVVEEIVGDIQDEFNQERPVVERRGPCLYSVDARLQLDEVSDILEINMDQVQNVETIGGWLYAQVETPPRIGQKASLDGNEFFVEEMEQHVRITRVLVRLSREITEEHEEIKWDSSPRITSAVKEK